MIIGQAAGIDVIFIARKGFCGVNLFHLVSWIAAIAILYLLSSLIVIRRPPGLYSDRTLTFQVANRKSFLRLLLAFIVLICPIFYSFSFVIRVVLRGRVISPSHNPLTYEGHVLVVTLQASSHTVAGSQPPHWDQPLCAAARTLLFPSPSLAARIWDPSAGWLPLNSPKN
jgi:hypothetical protein